MCAGIVVPLSFLVHAFTHYIYTTPACDLLGSFDNLTWRISRMYALASGIKSQWSHALPFPVLMNIGKSTSLDIGPAYLLTWIDIDWTTNNKQSIIKLLTCTVCQLYFTTLQHSPLEQSNKGLSNIKTRLQCQDQIRHSHTHKMKMSNDYPQLFFKHF